MEFYPGIDIKPTTEPMGFEYGPGIFGPLVENRRLDDIRKSLRNPNCDGPEIVYSIAMDIGKTEHRALLNELHLLYGVVTYAAGRLGCEPIRSQGHIHVLSPLSHWSTPEVYEIWDGEAIIYMQERAEDDPGRCFAVYGRPGDVIIVPPGWAHATISANPDRPLTFGAWCDRAYGFDYKGVRAHNGIAWFPVLGKNGIEWEANPAYQVSELTCKKPDPHPELNIVPGEAIYTTFEKNPSLFAYVPYPNLKAAAWKNYIP